MHNSTEEYWPVLPKQRHVTVKFKRQTVQIYKYKLIQ